MIGSALRLTPSRPIARQGPGIPWWPLLLVLFTFLVLAATVSVVNPLYESFDEIRHYRYIRRLVVEHRLPVQGAEVLRSQSHHPPLYHLVSALISGWVPSTHTPDYEHPINPFWGYRDWEVGVDNKLQYLHSPAESFPFREGYLAAMIPRWLNVVLGAVTVLLTYRLGRRVWPERPSLAWGAAALVAFNPQFLYLSGAMDNDIIAAATGAGVLLLSVVVAQGGLRWGRVIGLGLAYGLAILAKMHLVAMGGVIGLGLALGLRARLVEGLPGPGQRQRALLKRAIRWLVGMGVVLGIAALLSGWWFWRNWRLYGDPTGMNRLNELWAGRPAAGSWWALKPGLPTLWSSLWGRFGYGQIPLPNPIYQVLLVFCLLTLAGYLLPRRGSLPIATLSLMVVAVLLFTAVVSYYILIQPAGAGGRFLFPALSALAILVVGGLDRWFRRPARVAGGVALGMAAFALVALGGYLWPAVRYPPPARSPLPGQPLQVQFGDVARLHAAQIQRTTLRPGEPIFVTVVWEPLRQTESPYSVYVHLIDEEDVLIAQRDTWPGLGRAPTTTWRPGHRFVDTYRVDLPDGTYAPNRALVRVGLYEPTLGRLPVLDPDQKPLGDGITIGETAVDPHPGSWPNPLRFRFADEIALVGYTVEPRSLAPGQTLTLTLYWQPLRQPKHDYQVFAQVLDSTWQVWGSQDGPGPGWSTGQLIQDVRRITLRPDTPPGSYPIQVGLFFEETRRLQLVAPEGHYLQERALLGPVRVQDNAGQ